MNVVKEIQRINERELQLGGQGSWHDQYKDSAYIFIGGLPYDLTEGDVITIFSQYGEPVNVNMPRDKGTGKPKGFAFLMYEDQRSTVLAVDNLNGANILGRTIRVDHVSKYKNLERGEDGKMKEAEEEQLNALPAITAEEEDDDEDTVSEAPSIDPEDPMREWLLQRRKEEKAAGKEKEKKKKRKREDETPEERAARKERKRLKRLGLKDDKEDKSKSRSRANGTPPARKEATRDEEDYRQRDRRRHDEEAEGGGRHRERERERDRRDSDEGYRRPDERDRRRDRSRSPRRPSPHRPKDYRDERR